MTLTLEEWKRSAWSLVEEMTFPNVLNHVYHTFESSGLNKYLRMMSYLLPVNSSFKLCLICL